MNENLDLTIILKGCPPGTEFYHLVYGQVALIEMVKDEYPIVLELINKSIRTTLTKDGRLNNRYDGECLLYPSKTQRDWSKFERFWDKSKDERFDPKTLKPFDKILARDKNTIVWTCALFSHIEVLNEYYAVITDAACYRTCIPYNEETKHLVGTTDDCPEYYKWWEE